MYHFDFSDLDKNTWKKKKNREERRVEKKEPHIHSFDSVRIESIHSSSFMEERREKRRKKRWFFFCSSLISLGSIQQDHNYTILSLYILNRRKNTTDICYSNRTHRTIYTYIFQLANITFRALQQIKKKKEKKLTYWLQTPWEQSTASGWNKYTYSIRRHRL